MDLVLRYDPKADILTLKLRDEAIVDEKLLDSDVLLGFDGKARSYVKRFQQPQHPGSIPLVPKTIKRFLPQTLKLSLRQPPILTPIRLTPHQHEIHNPSHLMSHSHHRTPLRLDTSSYNPQNLESYPFIKDPGLLRDQAHPRHHLGTHTPTGREHPQA
jgi:hypothetical protein